MNTDDTLDLGDAAKRLKVERINMLGLDAEHLCAESEILYLEALAHLELAQRRMELALLVQVRATADRRLGR